MRSRNIALAAALLAVMLISPIMAPEAEALSESDISITIQGMDVDPSSSPVEFNLKNGSSARLTIFIVNKSDDRLSAYITSGGSEDGYLSVSEVMGSPIVIEPYRNDGSSDIAYLQADISVGKYSDTGDSTVTIDLHIQDLDTKEYLTMPVTVIVSITSYYDDDSTYNKFFGVVPNELDKPLGSAWFASLVTFIVLMILMWVICRVTIPFILNRTKVKKDGNAMESMKRSVTWMCMVIMTMYSINLSLYILGVGPNLTFILKAFTNIVYVTAGALLIWSIYKFIITTIIGNIEKNVDTGDSSLIPLFKMIGRLVIAVSAVALILASFGVDLAGILVSAGVVSLGITLGAQNVLNQFFSGIVLLSTRPFKKGDFLKINDEVYIVTKVKLMYTEFTNWGKDQIVTMPNNVVAGATLVNLTKGSAIARITVFVSVAYDSDMELVKSLLLKAANEHPHVIKDGSVSRPSTTMTEWQDSGVQYRLACYVDDFDSSTTYAGQLREVIFDMFKKNDIEIPYSRIQIDILSDADMNKEE